MPPEIGAIFGGLVGALSLSPVSLTFTAAGIHNVGEHHSTDSNHMYFQSHKPPHTAVAEQVLAAAGLRVFERGWLSSNNILVVGKNQTGLIDAGYVSHEAQTVALVELGLQGRELDLLLNTHIHSDHCGGNAALSARYPALDLRIPIGAAAAVKAWDPSALTYEQTGQRCNRFHFTGVLMPGTSLSLGDWCWEIHAAKGHDPDSIILFQPDLSLLISADALWGSGFGVVFPELDGQDAFSDVDATLNLIERLAPKTVIPGHGPVFQDVGEALSRARGRLAHFVRSPDKHLRYAMKVLLIFKLLELQQVLESDFLGWAVEVPYLKMQIEKLTNLPIRQGVCQLLAELESTKALDRANGMLIAN